MGEVSVVRMDGADEPQLDHLEWLQRLQPLDYMRAQQGTHKEMQHDRATEQYEL